MPYTIKKPKLLIGNLLDRWPILRTAAKHVLYIRFFFWRLKVRARDYSSELGANEIHWINPKMMKYRSVEEFDTNKDKETFSKVITGNWDLLKRKIEDSDEYQALKRRFMQGEKAEDDAYCGVSDEMSEGETKAAIDMAPTTKDEITVNVGRSGDLLLNRGIHALSKAQLLDVQQVPIRIIARHPQWNRFRKEICALALGKRLYQPITHPDLSDMPAEHRSIDRFNIIRENLSVKQGKLLDIGAQFGYFCHKFEELGFECYAVENSLEAVYFLKKLKRAENRRFKIVAQSILEWEDAKKLEFNVVLSLNIFHHFLKEKKSYLELINLLRNLQMKEMFFEPHLLDEPQMRNAYKNYCEKEFVEFILQNSQLKSAKLIGVAEDGRSLYKLY